MVLAAEESENTTYATLSEVFDTLRLLNDSMDFLDKDGDGWQILWTLCRNTYSLGEERQATIALLIRMLRLSSFDLKTYFVRERVTKMLNYTLRPDPGLEEASNLLLNLGGAEIIDTALWSSDGYTILHETVALAIEGQISTVLARGPDLHPLGFDYDYTPQEESPTSLAMYSSWAFMDWLRGLVTIEVDFEEFLNQELERNSLVHAGWEKETLRALFAYRHRPDLNFRKVWTCSDCSEVYCRVTVQPYWRHLLERIKQRIDPDSPAQADSQDGERDNADVRSIAEAASSSNDLAHEPDTTGHDGVSSESESEPELEDSHGYPAMISIRSDCVYPPHEVICVDCWLHYLKTGTPRPPHPGKRRFTGLYKTDSSIYNHSSSGDEVSEDEYSPYLIHS